MKKNYAPEDELLFLALGGSGEIGMNVNLYGCNGRWLMVDLGMTFSGNEYPGVDLVFADLDFIEDRADMLDGIVLTHGHEDHIGAVPYFAAELGVPLYATPFTAELVRRKLQEANLTGEVELIVVDDLERFEVGDWGVQYVPLAHSIAEGNALLIDTPHGRVFHTGDWKLDEDPIIGEPTTQDELREIGDAGVLALVCDSTNVFNPEPSGSEGAVYRGLLAEAQKWEGRRIMVTTFASNVARLQTLGNVARETGRQLCVAGRSLDRIIEVSQDNGYLTDLPDRVDWDTAMRLPRGEVLIMATGGQGEPRAALSRVAEGNHKISLSKGDVVLFSSRQIPGNEVAIGRIQNKLAESGIVMVTDRQSEIHVSGHPGRPELLELYDWMQPEILLPVHGEMRHMMEQSRVALEAGIPHAPVQKNGDILRLAPGKPERIAQIEAGRLVLDGDIIVPAEGDAITMRRRIAREGMVIVVLRENKTVQIDALGLPLDEDFEDFAAEAGKDIMRALDKLGPKDRKDARKVTEAARLAARRASRRWSGKSPQIKVMLPGS
ncbi:Ribonuclease J2 [Alteripontixanthobacter maritimus]|uniref:Ribonuclease J2 n=1 Tax=Alteripontixanthobacter maritimus TaxID=2161824 RepID=A0A369Q5N3_9SPHN|nr:ribonuclease J [Alteripontixanthobacter maritimus]RDC60034.1 Ribonuclease J2 [Alteripontixanthobacter maritimus]